MFTPKRPSVLSTPSSARVTRSQSLKTSNEFFNSTVSASGGVAAHNRISLTMTSIYNDTILESYKAPLPIKIKELIFNLKSQDSLQMNATILSNGHICLVNERKLFIWKLKKTFKNIQCNELSLPFSRSLIKQNCVSVECHNNKDYVGLCVTVEGSIRYWPSIFNEYLCVDEKFDLQQNDEVVHLMYISENFYLIITANGNYYSVSLENQEGKNIIVTKKIDLSSSLLSSVGRRMTSLIFGNGQSLNKNTQNFKSAARYKSSGEIFVLVDKNLQKLKINSDNTFTMLNQVNIEKLFHEEYIAQNVDSLRISIFFQDCAITKNSLYILAVVEDEVPKFVIGEIDTSNRTNELRIKTYHILNYRLSPSDNYQYKFFAMDNRHAFYLYNQNSVISFTGPTLEFTGESKFNTLGDRIIACNSCDNDLVFFSLNHEILKVKDNSLRLSLDEESFTTNRADQSLSNVSNFHFDLNSSVQSLGGEDTSFYKGAHRQSLDFTFSNLNSKEQLALTKLKESFQCYLKKEERESQLLIDDLIQNDLVDKKLDFLVVELSERLIDDVPAHDPRWAELTKSKSLNTNLIISNQLKGKIKLHEYFVAFLKKFNLWDKLSFVSYNGRDVKSKLALLEHAEKLQLALVIREQLYSKNQELINLAIEYTTKNREDLNSKLIYPHDVFYRRVSKIDEIFNALFAIENDVIKNNSTEQAINYLIDTTFFFAVSDSFNF
ncbi:unnamed protein product [Brachionus calyciflorus]|uniref:Nucleoporin Nup133/Nup155-like N-terminal domain-containing protein n=1 Tax=Brachionus calyciflorus TaxID=104777 RepID=A0A813RFW9_9BILA|nr:unnamed protein product [Brachionus calyciflorus]